MVNCVEERIRLRMALHAGEINYDEHGVTAAAINLTFRLLDSQPLKAALADSPGVLALIASSWFFDEVIRHSTAADPAAYRQVRVHVKESATVGWIGRPDYAYPPAAGQIPPAEPGMFAAGSMPAEQLLVPRQLPASVQDFTGRAQQLAALDQLLPVQIDTGIGRMGISG